MSSEQNRQDNKGAFKDTLNLPHTDFPIRAQSKELDPIMIQRWQDEKLEQKTFACNAGSEQFILHDGPPYANGHIHTGGAYNKMLKDITIKSQRMMGKHAPCTPGWDCHGLPIELKVTQENPGLSRSELLKQCRKYATKWIGVQKQEFRNLGVLMDFDRPYHTMDYSYEAAILTALSKVVGAGYVERKNKTVPWCTSCKTVLASAEIEYKDRTDPSVYVQFPLEESVVASLFPSLVGKQISMLVWTTTPWTLPLNQALLIKPKQEYVVLDINDKLVVVGAPLVDRLCATIQVLKHVVATAHSQDFERVRAQAQHPFIDKLVPIIADQSVEITDGTAVVHSAPGAGPIDYEIGVKHNLPIYSPVTPDGFFTDDIQPQDLAGVSIQDALGWVITKLILENRLLHKSSLRHSYPHCWRCHSPLIFRATKQWFFNLEKDHIKDRSVSAIDHLNMFPDAAYNQFKTTVAGRFEWCISRQRVWGVPIPALICNSCDQAYTSSVFIDRVAQKVMEEGIEYWSNVSIDEVKHLDDFFCFSCNAPDWRKELDIIDVWFESGVSHYPILSLGYPIALSDSHYPAEPLFPADLYVEGKDQHRAWFQSSLLTSMALNNKAPMKGIITHGFTVDSAGHKMSKSLGNVVAPQTMIDKLGTDGFRLWAASVDHAGDIVISDVFMNNVQEVFRKIRNTCRNLLANLYDFDIDKHGLSADKLRPIDQYALIELEKLSAHVLKKYQEYNFTDAVHQLSHYCAVDLSAFYLDIVKDCLYVEHADGMARRSVQTTYWYILDTLTKLMAPILSFTAEQLSDYYQKNKEHSIHLQRFADVGHVIAHVSQQDKDRLSKEWHFIKIIRSALLKAIEQQRAAGLIKHSLETQLTLHCAFDQEQQSLLNEFFDYISSRGQTAESFLKELVIVSHVSFVDSAVNLPESSIPGLSVLVEHASGVKCPRCWQWDTTGDSRELCGRCAAILS